jgi:hypothetical protein
MRCDHCGEELVIGAWPFCPHGRPMDGAHAIQTNEQFIGGMTLENLGHDPVTVYSREEFKQAMLRANVEQRIKWVPGDHYLQNFGAYIDPYTMEAARALVSRQGERDAETVRRERPSDPDTRRDDGSASARPL